MGEEVSDYIGRLVPAMQAAYGVAWNIEARGSPLKPMIAPGRSNFGPTFHTVQIGVTKTDEPRRLARIAIRP